MFNSVKKTIYYAKRNGIIPTYYAAKERIEDNKKIYAFEDISEDERNILKDKYKSYHNAEENKQIKMPYFSVVVPCFNTNTNFFIEMVDSVRNQIYEKFELILVDASTNNNLLDIYNERYSFDDRIIYHKLETNDGIAGNTNNAILLAKGDYICLLDHDDEITDYALMLFADKIIENEKMKTNGSFDNNCKIGLLYTDEDKCNTDKTRFYEPNIKKKDFDFDYLLSNNYICHFTAIRSDILKEFKFRKDYDGAQDFDLFLRIAAKTFFGKDDYKIVHIDKVAYHWRCHDMSTSANPASKKYAYDSGLLAIENILKTYKINGKVTRLPHLGFYRINYNNIFEDRPDIAAVCGKIVSGRFISGGISDEMGNPIYLGLHKKYSGGFTHRAACQQEAICLDIRNVRLREDFITEAENITGLIYDKEKNTFKDISTLSNDKLKELNISLSQRIREKGYIILYDPQMTRKI